MPDVTSTVERGIPTGEQHRIRAGDQEAAGERVWRLPLPADMEKAIDERPDYLYEKIIH